MTNRAPRTPGETRLLRRAARTVALQTALAVAVVVAVVAAVVLLAFARQQSDEADRTVRNAWSTADDVDDPPVGVWLLERRASGRISVTPGTPVFVRGLDPKALPAGLSRRTAGGQELRIYTGARETGRFSAVYDLAEGARERHRLLLSLGLAAALGIVGAAVVGTVIGRRAVRPLGEAMALQRRFVTDASHELRTPLAVLLTRAQLLRRHLPRGTRADVVTDADRIVIDTKNLADVVTDLLLSAELQHRPMTGEDVDVMALAVDVGAAMLPLATEHGVLLSVAPGDPVDPAGPVVRGAPAALRRALMSLVDNALAHTPAGGHVTIRADGDSDVVRLVVADDGEGLDPAQTGRLVQRFARDTDRGAGRRFGLGLALVDEVARAHGGRIEIAGRPGEGATFTLVLPRVTRAAGHTRLT